MIRNFQVFITEPRETPSGSADQTDQLRICINPQIITSSKEKSIIEVQMAFDQYHEPVTELSEEDKLPTTLRSGY